MHAAAASQEKAETAFIAPTPIGETSIIYPRNAPPHQATISVIVTIELNAAGEVEEIKLEQSGGRSFDLAVLTGAASFRFEPAIYKGQAHAAAIRYTAKFPVPKPKPQEQATTAPEESALLVGKVIERGTRKKVLDGQVIASHKKHGVRRLLLHDGGFTLKLPTGKWEIEIKAPGFIPFLFTETIKQEELNIRCLMQRQSYGDYEELVVGKRSRVEVSRTSLRGREIHRVPGTFGDPFKVTNTMPGVSQLMSLMPLPVIRGVGPSQSGFLLDGVPLPLFYHSLAGPSVIHSELIERIDFSPGNADVSYGGYTGGIINGVTTLPFQAKKSTYDIDLNLIQGGGLIRETYDSIDTEVIAAARVGYPDSILSLLNSQARLSYWDYQTRVSWGDRNFFVSAMVFGARDNFKTFDEQLVDGQIVEVFEPYLLGEFHKLVLRLRHQSPQFTGNYQLALSYDLSSIESTEPSARSLGAAPHIDWQWKILESLTLIAGIEADFRKLELFEAFLEQANPENPVHLFLSQGTGGLHKNGGTWLGINYKPSDAWLVSPGVRVDVYSDPEQSHWGIQPRIQARARIFKTEDQSLWLKLGSGIYHQPPRPYFTLPGLSVTALHLGLLRSHQNMVGAEWQIDSDWNLDVQAYFNLLEPTLFELNLSENQEEDPNTNPYERPPEPGQEQEEWLTSLSNETSGRAYGIEIMLRKEDSGRFFGWLSYALARSERINNQRYLPYDFDRTHTMNIVAGVKLPRNWELGGRLVFQTGSPISTDDGGIASGRTKPNWRMDLRMDKRIVFDEWLLDFYVEILNITVTRESGGLLGTDGLRYVLPTLGLRAIL